MAPAVRRSFDLALFVPPSVVAGWAYLKGRPHGALLTPIYAVFLSVQMTALRAKIVWMSRVGASAGPALLVIPMLLVGAVVVAAITVAPHRKKRIGDGARPGLEIDTVA